MTERSCHIDKNQLTKCQLVEKEPLHQQRVGERLSFTDKNADGMIYQTMGSDNEVLQESNYYPFGLQTVGK
ncbi:MAG: hypothetical protein HKO66_02395 [Saprospiraceae bacterium]|nr:hypothetical protein [Saprospiraceae bacterium]